MKKNVIIFIFFFGLCVHTYAQKHTSFGVFMGGGYSSLSTYSKSKIRAYKLGFYKTEQITNFFSLRSGLSFGNRGGDSFDEVFQLKYTYNQLSLPVSIEVHPSTQKDKISFGVGLYVGYNFNKQLKYYVEEIRLNNSTIIGEPDYRPTDEFSDFEWGVLGGIGFRVNKVWKVNIGISASNSFIYNRNAEHDILLISKQDWFTAVSGEEKVRLDDMLRKARSVNVFIEIQRDIF